MKKFPYREQRSKQRLTEIFGEGAFCAYILVSAKYFSITGHCEHSEAISLAVINQKITSLHFVSLVMTIL